MADNKYKRVLLKISGEALLGDQQFGIDPCPVEMIADEIIHNLPNLQKGAIDVKKDISNPN